MENSHLARRKIGGGRTVLPMAEFGDIKGETESTVVAAQDQALSTNCFKKNILKEETESKCDYVKNTKNLITTSHQDVPFLQIMNM